MREPAQRRSVRFVPAFDPEPPLLARRFEGAWSTIALVVLVLGALVTALPSLDAAETAWLVALSGVFLLLMTRGAHFAEKRGAPDRWRAMAALFALQLLMCGVLLWISRGYALMVIFGTASQAVLYLPRRYAAGMVVACLAIGAISLWTHTPVHAPRQLGSVLAAMAFVVAFSWIAVRQHDARHEVARLASQLAEANVRLEAHAQEASALATERERNRIAREIHDTVGHCLTAAHVQLLAARAVLEVDPARASRALERATGLTHEALDEVRRAVVVMRHERSSPLPERLEQLAQDLNATSIRASLHVVGEPRPLPMPVEVALYRAAQEAVTNVHRHAHASRVEITLRFGDDATIGLKVKDDGQGDGSEAPPGVGLELMRERLKELGGHLEVERSGEGFSVQLEVPA